MPPVNRTAARDRVEQRRKEREENKTSNVGNPPPKDEKATTTPPPKTKPKLQLLESKLDRTYASIGLFISPLARWYPYLGPLGYGMREHSTELAHSWIPYLEENPRMLKRVEDFTTVSALGELVGIHVMVLAKATPNQQVQEALKAQKKAEEDLAREARVRESMETTPGGMPARDMSTGGPGDTVRVPNNPSSSANSPVPPVATSPSGPNVVTHTTTGSKAAIVTPEQMGIQVFGPQQGAYDYSAAPPPNGRGIING